MSKHKLDLQPRQVSGKKSKALRDDGLITSVVYGADAPILTASPYNITEKIIRAAGYHSPVELVISGKPQLALIKTVDVDPIRRTIRNVGFQAISADEVVEATTPITIMNFETSPASKANLNILQVLEELDIKAKPADLPSQLEIDAANLSDLGDRLTVADLVLPKGVEISDKELDPETVVANLFDPAAEAAAREAEEAAAAAAAEAESPAADVPAENGDKPAEEASAEAK